MPSPTLAHTAPTYGRIVQLALPIIAANAAVPLLGLVDTAIIGRTGSEVQLAAIALGALVFSFVYWGFGFLRMGTTGFVAQASGANDAPGLYEAVLRALLLAGGIGLGLITVQGGIHAIAFRLLEASPAVIAEARTYVGIRIWGAPATLAMFAILGTLIGLGETRKMLVLQLVLNGLNIMFNLVFVVGLGLGVAGIAWGTLVAEWIAAAVGFVMMLSLLRAHSTVPIAWPWSHMRNVTAWRRTVSTNSDIMIRTLFLLAGFGWFARHGARFGDDVLAANHILLQFVSLSAFFLDGFAFVVEAMVGQTLGAGRTDVFRVVLRRSTVLAAITACLLAGTLWLGGPTWIAWLTDIDSVRTSAESSLHFAALYVLLSFGAFQLDGVFIGATESRAMRNGAIASFAGLWLLGLILIPRLGVAGLWVSFIAFVVLRAVTLLAYLPSLWRRATAASPHATRA